MESSGHCNGQCGRCYSSSLAMLLLTEETEQ